MRSFRRFRPIKNDKEENSQYARKRYRLWKIIYLASPTMHVEELQYITQACAPNRMRIAGESVNESERLASAQAGVTRAVSLSGCTAALPLCAKLAGEALYGRPSAGHGATGGNRALCSDMTFAATLNPVAYEGGIPAFIDTEPDSRNMDPAAPKQAFTLYPDVRSVMA